MLCCFFLNLITTKQDSVYFTTISVVSFPSFCFSFLCLSIFKLSLLFFFQTFNLLQCYPLYFLPTLKIFWDQCSVVRYIMQRCPITSKATYRTDTHLEWNSRHSFIDNPQWFDTVASMMYFTKM